LDRAEEEEVKEIKMKIALSEVPMQIKKKNQTIKVAFNKFIHVDEVKEI